MQAAVETHHRQVGEARPRLPDHGDRHVHVAPLPHDRTVREEPVTVPGTRTGTPGSTGTPALPFDIQRVCGPDIGCTFPRCGIVPPFRIRRSGA